ncbi:MAG TPA: GNAT family N-acetyltransferase [Chthoniobacter sp.]|nr:GNAT family N-acetyltransferase [Chthoniobacter sp.]
MKIADPIVLREWRDEDLEPFAEMNADAKVMEYFPQPLSPAESAEFMMAIRTRFAERGWGLWAVEVDGAFAGFTGLAQPRFEAHFTPCVEIGWRFRREYWGRGIAYAAALQAESFAFEHLKLPGLVSFTAASNTRSQRLMERLGFTRNERDDFLHPSLPVESPLRPHVLYRKQNLPSLVTPEPG